MFDARIASVAWLLGYMSFDGLMLSAPNPFSLNQTYETDPIPGGRVVTFCAC